MRFLIYFLTIIFLVGIGIPAQAFDNLDGSSIIIEESDGTPSGTPGTLKVTNGSLTDNGDGTFTLSLSAGSGDNISVNSSPVVDPDFVSTGSEVNFIDTSNTITVTIKDDIIAPANISATDTEADEECLTYEATGSTFEWQTCGSGGGDSVSIDGGAVTDPDFVSTGDIDFVDTSNTVTANINAGSIVNADVNASAAIAVSKMGFDPIEETEMDSLSEFDTQIGTTGTASASTFLRGDNSWATPAGGGSTPDKEITFTALSLEFINAGDSFPAPVKDAGTNIDINVLAYDAGTDECAGKNFVVPSDIAASGSVTFRLYYFAATAATNSAYWDFKHRAINNAESWDQSLTTESDGGCAGTATQDQVVECEWTETISNLGWSASDTVEFEVCRDADNASDNLSGDANLINFTVEIPR